MNDQMKQLVTKINEASKLWHRQDLCDKGVCDKCGNTTPGRATVIERERTAVGGSYDAPRTVSYCPVCSPEVSKQDAELEQLRIEENRKAERRDNARRLRDHRRQVIFAEQGIPRQYRNCRFRTFRPQNDGQANALADVSKWVNDPAARVAFPNFVLMGPPGLGKTHMATAAWRKFARRGQNVVRIVDTELNTYWRSSHSAYDNNSGYAGLDPDELVTTLASADVLIWDDLGRSKLSEGWASLLFEVIDRRYEAQRPTLVTTNYSAAELARRVGPATSDRVLSGAVYRMEGQSQRGVA